MYSVVIAYLLWLISGFGALGLHRFYLGKLGTGILFALTGGFGMIGSIYDFLTLPEQVREANLRLRYRNAMNYELDSLRNESRHGPLTGILTRSGSVRSERPERTILRVARKNKGVVTPAEVALDGDLTLDEAKKQLEVLVNKGFADMRVRSSGVIVYVFPEFMEDGKELEAL